MRSPMHHEDVPTAWILVADDDVRFRVSVATALRADGFGVLEAGSGVEALEVLGRHGGRLDLLLSDLVMPAMGGCELADRLRSERPEVKVLLVSGGPPCPAVGDRPFLAKPFPLDGLGGVVRGIRGR